MNDTQQTAAPAQRSKWHLVYNAAVILATLAVR